MPDGRRHGRARRRLRRLGEPFVVAPPAGVRVRTRLRLAEADAAVLRAVGEHLGVLAGRDLAWRCAQGRPDATGGGQGRAVRKQALTAACTSRWAGAITRTSEDAWRLAQRNLLADQRSLRARVGRLRRRLAVPVGARQGRTRGYATRGERWDKQRRLQVLQTRLRWWTPGWRRAGSRCVVAAGGWPGLGTTFRRPGWTSGVGAGGGRRPAGF